MNVEYELTKDDLNAFNLCHTYHSPTVRCQYYRSWFIPAVIWLLVCVSFWYLINRSRGTPFQTFLDLLPLFCGVPIYLIYFPWAYRRKLKKIITSMISEGQNTGLLSRHIITISPECISDSGEFTQSSTSWRIVERVEKNNDYLFIYTSSLAAIIIPRRAFADATEFYEFARKAAEYYEHALA